jgi:hypothetical protein
MAIHILDNLNTKSMLLYRMLGGFKNWFVDATSELREN